MCYFRVIAQSIKLTQPKPMLWPLVLLSSSLASVPSPRKIMRPVAIASLPHLAPREYRPVYPMSLIIVKASHRSALANLGRSGE